MTIKTVLACLSKLLHNAVMPLTVSSWWRFHLSQLVSFRNWVQGWILWDMDQQGSVKHQLLYFFESCSTLFFVCFCKKWQQSQLPFFTTSMMSAHVTDNAEKYAGNSYTPGSSLKWEDCVFWWRGDVKNANSVKYVFITHCVFIKTASVPDRKYGK